MTEAATASVYPIFGGRWQPPHKGHTELMSVLAERAMVLTVATVNPTPMLPPDPGFDRFHPSANPYGYWQRARVLQEFARRRLPESHMLVVPSWHPRVRLVREATYLPARPRRAWVVTRLDEAELIKRDDFVHLGESVETVDVGKRFAWVRGTVARSLTKEGEIRRHFSAEALDAFYSVTNPNPGLEPVVASTFDAPTSAVLEQVAELCGAERMSATVAIFVDDELVTPGRLTAWERALLLQHGLRQRGCFPTITFLPTSEINKPAAMNAWLPPLREWNVVVCGPEDNIAVEVLSMASEVLRSTIRLDGAGSAALAAGEACDDDTHLRDVLETNGTLGRLGVSHRDTPQNAPSRDDHEPHRIAVQLRLRIDEAKRQAAGRRMILGKADDAMVKEAIRGLEENVERFGLLLERLRPVLAGTSGSNRTVLADLLDECRSALSTAGDAA